MFSVFVFQAMPWKYPLPESMHVKPESADGVFFEYCLASSITSSASASGSELNLMSQGTPSWALPPAFWLLKAAGSLCFISFTLVAAAWKPLSFIAGSPVGVTISGIAACVFAHCFSAF